MKTIKFEELFRLRRISERAFVGCKLYSIAIPALTEGIDGSAFLNCPLIAIHVLPASPNFAVEEILRATSDRTEIVRHFGLDREIVVGRKVKVLGKSRFEGLKHRDEIYFEVGYELEGIGPAAIRDCESLASIEISSSVTILAESSFEGCTELASCLIGEDSSLVSIGARAFARCISLRSFYFRFRLEKSAATVSNTAFICIKSHLCHPNR
jgi:hypothetical protein